MPPNVDIMPGNHLSHQAQLLLWIDEDEMRANALLICSDIFDRLGIKDWYIAAGFVRNLVWDKLHGNEHQPLNDIDVIYWCDIDVSVARDRAIETELRQRADLPWSVKNQARMHLKNGDKPYLSCFDAMSHWPEQQTAVGLRLLLSEALGHHAQHQTSLSQTTGLSRLKICAVFGLACLFDFTLTPNPTRDKKIFVSRVVQKDWLNQYPKLTQV